MWFAAQAVYPIDIGYRIGKQITYDKHHPGNQHLSLPCLAIIAQSIHGPDDNDGQEKVERKRDGFYFERCLRAEHIGGTVQTKQVGAKD